MNPRTAAKSSHRNAPVEATAEEVAAVAKVAEAAVIGIAHPKWQERPILIVVRAAGSEVTKDAVAQVSTSPIVHLQERSA